MDQVYSLTLLMALVAGGLGLAAGVMLWWYVRRPTVGEAPRRLPKLRRLVRVSGLTALFFAVTSMTVHAVFGHGPGTAEALGPVAFIRIHPVYVGVFGLIGALFILLRLGVRP